MFQDFTHAVAENGILGYEDDMAKQLFRRGVELRRLKKQAERAGFAPSAPLLKAFRRAGDREVTMAGSTAMSESADGPANPDLLSGSHPGSGCAA